METNTTHLFNTINDYEVEYEPSYLPFQQESSKLYYFSPGVMVSRQKPIKVPENDKNRGQARST